jgi:hypothetical protein
MLEVIGAGYGRTGTNALKMALELLGFGPCHHMFELRDNPEKVAPWAAVFDGGTPDWDELFTGYRSQVDWPGAYYWRELASHYPDAKVVLSVRDPKAWYASLANTLLPFAAQEGQHSPPHRNEIARISKLILEPFSHSEETAVARFNAHTDDVCKNISANRLLVYDVQQGWQPLCEFLGVDIPNIAFPSTNSTADFQQRIKQNSLSD